MGPLGGLCLSKTLPPQKSGDCLKNRGRCSVAPTALARGAEWPKQTYRDRKDRARDQEASRRSTRPMSFGCWIMAPSWCGTKSHVYSVVEYVESTDLRKA